jgi:hypothetical protein
LSNAGIHSSYASPATREPEKMISQILMVIDNFSFVGEYHNFQNCKKPVLTTEKPIFLISIAV